MPGKSILTYLILFVVAGYLFQVNPVLCVGLVGAVVFFKVRGFFGGRGPGELPAPLFI